MAIKSIITVANKLSSVITENSIVAKSIRKNDDIVKKSIPTSQIIMLAVFVLFVFHKNV